MYLAIFSWCDNEERDFGTDFKISDNLEEIKKYSLDIMRTELTYLPEEDLLEKMDDMGNWESTNSRIDIHNIKLDTIGEITKDLENKLVKVDESEDNKCLLVRFKNGKYDCLKTSKLNIVGQKLEYHTLESVCLVADELNKNNEI